MQRVGRLIPTLMLSTALSATLAAPVVAAEVSAEQARRLEQQLRDWVSGFLVPGMALPARPVQLVPEGDHYLASIPIGSTSPVTLTATLTPTDGDRWSIRQVRFPSPATFALTVPTGEKNPDGTPKLANVSYTVRMEEQDGSGLYDPSFRTASNFRSAYRNVTIDTVADGKAQNTRASLLASETTLTPNAGGRLDVLSNGSFEGYQSNSVMPDGTPLRIEARNVEVVTRAADVSRDKGMDAVRSMFKLGFRLVASASRATGHNAGSNAGPNASPNASPGLAAPEPADIAAMQAMIATLRDFASAVRIEETLHGLRVRAGDAGADLETALLAIEANTPGGKLVTALDLAATGLQLVNLPMGPFEPFVPRHFAIRPTVSGITTTELLDAANASLSAPPGGQGAGTQALQQLFLRGGVVIGLEKLSFDVAGSEVAGQATLRVPAPMTFDGDGRFSVSNLDGLIARLQQLPAMAQVMPVVLFAKGIGRVEGGNTVWNVTYKQNKLLVNGTDLSAMTGAR